MTPLSPTRQRVIAEARKLVGTRFWWHGRTAAGLDCYGVLYAAGRAAGLLVPDVTNYSARSIDDEARAPALAWFEPLVAIDAAIPGDVLEIAVQRHPKHYAILVADDFVVHANLAHDVRRVTESRMGPEERRAVVAAYRFPGVDADG